MESKKQLATRGVPRLRRAISWAASGATVVLSLRALMATICASSSTVCVLLNLVRFNDLALHFVTHYP